MEQHGEFNRIYEETHRDVLRYVVAKTNRADDVEDILQEVYRSFYVHLCRNGAQSVRFEKQYLIAIAKKELARFYRNKSIKAEREVLLSDDAEETTEPLDEQYFTNEAAAKTWEIVRGEPLLSYKAFTLYYGFSMRICDIARAIGATEPAVKQRLLRTRNKIRKELRIELKTELKKELKKELKTELKGEPQ